MQFQQFSQKQMEVLTWWSHPEINRKYDAIIADGAVRSGKTTCMSISFVLWAMKNFSNCNLAICGKTVESCKRNVINPLIDAMNGIVRLRVFQSKNYVEATYNRQINRFYIFGGKDEGSAALIQGITLAGVLLDEVALMPRSFVEQALARCSVEGSKFWFNCNPQGPRHWFYTDWILDEEHKKRRYYISFRLDDNLTLSDEIKQRYHSTYSGVFYERFILGRWVAAEGIIYPMFLQNKHIVPTQPRLYRRYYISCDYGTLNPMSMGLWGEYQGKYYRVAEYYHDGRKKNDLKTDEQYYAELAKLAAGRTIDSVVVDPSAASFIQCIRNHGRFTVRKAINDVLDGIRRVASKLNDGTLLFNDCCKACIGEFGMYVWDEKAEEDRPIKENDHAMDDVRYFVMTILDRPGGVR